jgi:ribosomal protein L5
MKSYSKHTYQNIIRWDALNRFKINNFSELPELQKLTVNLHESALVNRKDKFILSFFLELITGQRVSPEMISEGSYKNRLVVKRSQPSVSRAQVTLRKDMMFSFFDKWITLSLPKAFQFSGYRQLNVDKNGGTSFYSDDIYSFVELDGIHSLVYKCNGFQLQLHVKKSNSLRITRVDSEIDNNTRKNISARTEYILSGLSLPLKTEGVIMNRNYPNLNFFNL